MIFMHKMKIYLKIKMIFVVIDSNLQWKSKSKQGINSNVKLKSFSIFFLMLFIYESEWCIMN
jgi:hypothetical protein